MKPEPVGKSPGWDQAAIDRILSELKVASEDREILIERLWWMVRGEVMHNLRMKLRNDIMVEEAEFAALREFNRRLKTGVIGFLNQSYMKYIANTAIRFVAHRKAKLVAFESGNSTVRTQPGREKDPEEGSLRYADLYYCIEKLNQEEKRLLGFHHVDDLGLEEVASKIGASHDATRKRHSRILIKLRLCLEGLGEGGWS
jgi:RNA polymerase sigma factor (sigma-70 family)